MRKWNVGLALLEVIVVIVIVLILGGLLFFWLTQPTLGPHHLQNARRACSHNLMQIGKACVTYQEPYGDFWPSQWDGMFHDGRENDGSDPVNSWEGYDNPMQSLAMLYPEWIDNVDVFWCPGSSDRPNVVIRQVGAARHSSFGPDPDGDGLIEFGGRKYDPAEFSGKETALPEKCSYLYDPLTHFRAVAPGQAMTADADGYIWTLPDGSMPPYRRGWKRIPRKSNHEGFQNVLYFDTHVSGTETIYCSTEPRDNIFARNGAADTPDGRWSRDTDAVLWDEENYPDFEPD